MFPVITVITSNRIGREQTDTLKQYTVFPMVINITQKHFGRRYETPKDRGFSLRR